MNNTYPHPVWTLGTETEALKAEANASLASAVFVRLLVAFLWARGKTGERRWRTVAEGEKARKAGDRG